MIRRPLEFYEAIHSNNNIVVVSFIEGSFAKKEIDNAWYLTQLRHPYLRMELQSDGSLPYKLRFQERPPFTSIPDHQFKHEVGDLTDESWQSTLHEMTNQPRLACPELWYLRLRSNPDLTDHQVYIMVNHCGSDGIGIFAIMNTFLNFLEIILCKEPIPKVKSLEFLNIQARIPPDAPEIPSPENVEDYLPPLKYQGNQDPNAPAVISAVWFAFDELKTKQLLDACKRLEVTVQAAVTCAQMLGVAINSLELKPLPHHMLVWIPVNLRSFVIPPISNEHSICGSSSLIYEQDLRPEQELWNLVQETTRLIKAGVASRYPLKFRFDIQNQADIMVKPNPFTFMASSIGKTPIQKAYRGFTLHGVRIIAGAFDSARVSSAGMVAHAYTVQDCFTLTFGYCDPSFSPEWAARFAGIMEKFLTLLAKDEEGNQSVVQFIEREIRARTVSRI